MFIFYSSLVHIAKSVSSFSNIPRPVFPHCIPTVFSLPHCHILNQYPIPVLHCIIFNSHPHSLSNCIILYSPPSCLLLIAPFPIHIPIHPFWLHHSAFTTLLSLPHCIIFHSLPNPPPQKKTKILGVYAPRIRTRLTQEENRRQLLYCVLYPTKKKLTNKI